MTNKTASTCSKDLRTPLTSTPMAAKAMVKPLCHWLNHQDRLSKYKLCLKTHLVSKTKEPSLKKYLVPSPDKVKDFDRKYLALSKHRYSESTNRANEVWHRAQLVLPIWRPRSVHLRKYSVWSRTSTRYSISTNSHRALGAQGVKHCLYSTTRSSKGSLVARTHEMLCPLDDQAPYKQLR